MATSIERCLKRVAEAHARTHAHAHSVQPGCVNGRNVARHLIRLEVLCRIARRGTYTEQRMQAFVSYGVKAA
eukprot:3393831-Pyramimonas_sp.AAC.1